ncbi:MAG: glucosidase [Candidatus Eisenbacteria bacterium]|uniref:Glucosidase n=1 Tax=Eiseniibacteriota bacterium TaxID=2212470 RepID=A0A7Y2E9C8_UNCEI|nr:glucosidase [Candidatus Eisenbacteria bacterium]
MNPENLTKEGQRLEASRDRLTHWKRWGPYLSERQWGTVREDYSEDGSAWQYFPHDHARSRAYRWGEDGIAGISDRRQFVCFAPALWNGQDPFLKERLFGLSNPQGNHGEDVKEMYFYLDATPTHSYMKYLYKYPQAGFPYEKLVEENGARGYDQPEYDLMDTGVFDESRYFDVFVEYAKASEEDICIRITAHNRGPEAAPLWVLPTLWFRNLWSFGLQEERPRIRNGGFDGEQTLLEWQHLRYGTRWLVCDGKPQLLFTENETNAERLWNLKSSSPHVKDAFHDYVVDGRKEAVNPEREGSKASPVYHEVIAPGESMELRLRLTNEKPTAGMLQKPFEDLFKTRLEEADAFYERRVHRNANEEGRSVQRQAFAGLIWNKQYYHYDVDAWLKGDPGMPAPPSSRKQGRNSEWMHLYNEDVVSMPDKWEYPWYAAWDLAFHCIPLAQIDPEFAKNQLILMLREWYMHPNGQLPAYEWEFGDVNPPVHAWAAWRVYKIEKRILGRLDRPFLERIFHKLMLNFTWWLNRKDAEGNNIFQGGFLGLDNIGVFDRSRPLPTGGHINQSDGTSWMAMYSLNMMGMALELARDNPAYEDVASKFFEHFMHIAKAMNAKGDDAIQLWDEEDGFFYDVLQLPDGSHKTMNVRSVVGLIPLFAAESLDPELVEKLPGFRSRMEWFLKHDEEAGLHFDVVEEPGKPKKWMLSVVNRDRLRSILTRLTDENEFLSDYGVRGLSKFHEGQPYVLRVGGEDHTVRYTPGESDNGAFGGNSNWRGPIWFPINYLIIESLQKFHHHLGEDFTVPCGYAGGEEKNLGEIAEEISRRLVRLFMPGENGHRPINGGRLQFQKDPHWKDHVLFYEYFHGDDGTGLGASHQTGWTALVAKLLEQIGVNRA